MNGKLIVLDGGDGAGKATQTKLLVERLRSEGVRAESLDFPQYTQNTFGALLRECLNGKRGDFMQIDARIASTLYAADRFESKPQLEAWLADGVTVILDRYVSSNMLHQGAKLGSTEEVEDFLTWLEHVEHTIFGLPRPDLIVYLDVPHHVRVSLKQAAVAAGKHTTVLDAPERDAAHQMAVEVRAREIVAGKHDWVTIGCLDERGDLRAPALIHADIYRTVTAAVSR